ncbi:MAG: ATP-grasp domain-containing protein [Methanosarcina thermophila]|jgi:predicted ATP-grasp superfamily ATP-dependent carboligase|uniref:COG1821 family protein n=1 Tax=Methanosarcina thermophila CHTI-55 TaxID=1434121 RepID=A0A0E3KQU1_METTE|nr:ATP-grasp domain-containing protein [Methanosarcina thermophila]AKB14825.1 COG1821 family protein [Methanosarcina thermophila CHTI-55]NLU58145.1 ATP-grasp domain-containing protein [Methanosarcina thermophila]
MKILIAEFAVGTEIEKSLIPEGAAMLKTLVESFVRLGYEVYYPSAGTKICAGTRVESTAENFRQVIGREAKSCDAGLIIAPDSMLPELNEVLEENTVNLGCSPRSAACCADKLLCAEILKKAGIKTPEIAKEPEKGKRYITKPRFGCGAEATYLVTEFENKEGFFASEYIEGEHLSVSLIAGKKSLPLTVNRQFIEFGKKEAESGEKGKAEVSGIKYNGSLTPYQTERREEIYETAISTAECLNCFGYVGVDIILTDFPYVVDVNPRPTASLFGISRVMREEIGDLILKNRFGELPDHVNIEGEFCFSKDALGELFGRT